MKNICVIGIGGIGGYFGGKIAEKVDVGRMDYRVTFVARGEHLEQIRRHGLILNTSEKTNIICRPFLATDDLGMIDKPDICFICVKGYDLDGVVTGLKKRIDAGTVIIPLLNGVDIYDRIRTIVPENVVLPSCVYVGTHIEKPGIVTQKGGDGMILSGKDPLHPEYELDDVAGLLEKTGIKYKFMNDPFPAIWEKYMFVAAFGLAGALTGKTLGEMYDDPECTGMITGVMNEIRSIASKAGIILRDSIVTDSIEKAKNFSSDTRTSYQRDIELKGRVNEGESFGGTIIRLGKKFGVSTGVTEGMYNKINGSMT
jgi:2-dehydropantoate 2-reductase